MALTKLLTYIEVYKAVFTWRPLETEGPCAVCHTGRHTYIRTFSLLPEFKTLPSLTLLSLGEGNPGERDLLQEGQGQENTYGYSESQE